MIFFCEFFSLDPEFMHTKSGVVYQNNTYLILYVCMNTIVSYVALRLCIGTFHRIKFPYWKPRLRPINYLRIQLALVTRGFSQSKETWRLLNGFHVILVSLRDFLLFCFYDLGHRWRRYRRDPEGAPVRRRTETVWKTMSRWNGHTTGNCTKVRVILFVKQ